MELQSLLNAMWSDYCALNPAAQRIYDLFNKEGELVVNDHIALRTFRHPKLGLEGMAQTFKNLGYQEKQDYHFKAKKLYAKHYEHTDPSKPKIFISELLLDQLSAPIQKILDKVIQQIPEILVQAPHFTYSGRSWKVSYADYETLAKESEYAAWVSSIGFRPNHFTVYVNEMKKYNTIPKINDFLEAQGVPLNTSGGKIKGSESELLEQSSTMANPIKIQFEEGFYEVPGCYYEFARRYSDAQGKLYQGFVAASADKIFESTDRK